MVMISSLPGALGAIALGFCVLLAGAAPLGAQPKAQQQQSQAEQDENLGLPDKAGRDEVVGICTACHSLKLVAQQRLPRHVWEELLETMNRRHGMAKLAPEDEKLILDYLTENLGPPPSRRRF